MCVNAATCLQRVKRALLEFFGSFLFEFGSMANWDILTCRRRQR